jgi:hypothetical protein
LLGIFKKKSAPKESGFEELLMELKGIDYSKCPHCQNGVLIRTSEIEKKRYGPSLIKAPVVDV